MTAKLIPIRKSPPLEVSLSDSALVAACSAGDADALAVLYDRYAQQVARFLGRLAHVDRQDVEDLVQEVFMAVFRSAARYKGLSEVRTWIFAIAANHAKTRARSGRRGRLALSEVAKHVEAVKSEPEADIAARQAVALLQQGIANLKHDLRVAFVMCHVENVPGPQAAKALGVPVGTLYRRLHQARAELSKHMGGAWP